MGVIIEKAKPIIFYVIFFLFILALNTTARIYDFDLWARLIAGMGFVQTGQVLKHDFLSYTPTHLWFDHEWGSGVIFYLTQHFFGPAGILVLQAVLIFLTFFIITKVVELRGVKTTHAYNFLFYFFALSTMGYVIRSPIRCQLFSFLFFALFLYLLERARKGQNKSLIFIPFLMIIWNNLHGGSVAGIGLILIYIVGEFLNKKPVKNYIYAFIASVLVLSINPWGFGYLKFLFKAATMPRPYVMEWWGIFFTYNIHKYIKFKVFASVLVLTEIGIVIKQLISKTFTFDKTKLLVLAVTLFLAIQHAKMIPLFVISATCFLYDDFYSAFDFLTKNFFKKISLIKDALIYTIILIFVFSNITKAFQVNMNLGDYPFREIEFVRINDIKGNLLINFGLGSYASYKLYPNNKIYMDGRYEEVYDDSMVPMLKKFYLMNKGWDEVLKKFPPDIMIIETYYPVYKTLKYDKDWKEVFRGENFGVFVKTDMAKMAKTAKSSYKIPSDNIDYYKKTLFDTEINFMLQSKHEQN